VALNENTCVSEAFVTDDDASVARSAAYWKLICDKAGLGVVNERMQDDFPDDIYIYIY
jgi:hypothetical protein